MLLAMLVLLGQDMPLAAAVTEYREKTSAGVRCAAPKDDGEISVCARRQAYRYQLPLISTNPRNDARAQENLLSTPEAQGAVACGKGAFLVRCGSVGVGVTIGLGGGGYIRRAPPP